MVLAVNAFLLAVVGGAILFYLFFAEDYYVLRKGKVMNTAFESIRQFDLAYLQPENEQVIQALEEESFSVLICDETFQIVYSSKISDDKTAVEEQVVGQKTRYLADAEASYEEELTGKPISLYGLITQNDQDFYVYITEYTRIMRRAIAYVNNFLADVLLLLMVLGSIFAYFLAGWIVRPVLDIQKVANKMAQNDFSVRIADKQPKNEVGELAGDINRMAEKIQRNVNDLNNYNYLLLRQNRDMAEFEEMRKKLVSNITHQLKTPLAIISSQVELLQYEYDASKKEYYFSSIMEEIDKMSVLISSILQKSRLEHQIQNSVLRRTDLSALMRKLLPKYENWFSAGKIWFSSQIEPDCIAWVDELQIEQAVNNYMMNAKRHTKAGGEVKLLLEAQEEDCCISVYNDGACLPAEEMKRIWIDFYQSGKQRADSNTEIGLGLYIVQDIMHQHKGSCGVLNRENGVEFWLKIPKKQKEV